MVEWPVEGVSEVGFLFVGFLLGGALEASFEGGARLRGDLVRGAGVVGGCFSFAAVAAGAAVGFGGVAFTAVFASVGFAGDFSFAATASLGFAGPCSASLSVTRVSKISPLSCEMSLGSSGSMSSAFFHFAFLGGFSASAKASAFVFCCSASSLAFSYPDVRAYLHELVMY